METAKDTRKHWIAITGMGGAVVVLGGVVVVTALAVANSVSAFKFRKTTAAAADQLNKGNEEADVTSAENGAQSLEIVEKMGGDKTDHENELLNKDEEKSIEDTLTDRVTQNDHLAKYQVNPQEIEAEEEYGENTVVPKTPYDEAKFIEAKDEVQKAPHDEVECKQEEDKAPNEEEENSSDVTATDHVTQNDHLAKYQVSQEQVEGEATTVVLKVPHTVVEHQEDVEVVVMVVPKTPLTEVEYKEEENETLNGDEEKSGEGSIEEEDGAILVVPKIHNVEIEYKEEDNKALNEDEEKCDEDAVTDRVTRMNYLTKYQVKPREIEAEEEDEVIKVLRESTQVEVEYKEEKDGALNEDEEQNGEYRITDHVTPKDRLEKYRVHPQELEPEEDDDAIMVVPRTPHVEYKDKEDEAILVVPRTTDVEYKDKESTPIIVVPEVPHVEVEYKEGFEREQRYEHGEDVKKYEELAEEIEVDTQSYENGSIDEDGGDTAEKVAQIQHMEKEHNGDEILKREERVMVMAPQLNRYATEDELEVTEGESVYVEEEQESSETNKDDEEMESSEGTGDPSVESNIDAIWPAEAVKDILMEIKQRKIGNQISEEKTEDYIKVEAEEKSLTNDNVYATNCCEIEDSGESVLNYKKRYIKELLLDLSNTRIWIWAILVLVLVWELAAPLVPSVGGVTKLFLVVFFVIGLSRVFQTIIS